MHTRRLIVSTLRLVFVVIMVLLGAAVGDLVTLVNRSAPGEQGWDKLVAVVSGAIVGTIIAWAVVTPWKNHNAR